MNTKGSAMSYTLNAIRAYRDNDGIVKVQEFVFKNYHLGTLIKQAGEFDSGSITDPDGSLVYEVSFPEFLVQQAS